MRAGAAGGSRQVHVGGEGGGGVGGGVKGVGAQ